MRSPNPSAAQQRLSQLKKFVYRHRRLPTYEQMCELFDVASKNAVFKIIQNFISDGWLAKDGAQLITTPAFYSLPVLGSIRAGLPSMDDNQVMDQLIAGEFGLKKPDAYFVLKVSGDSMIGAGINDGDVVILDSQRSPRPGDIVAAYIDEEWTLKYYRPTRQGVTLEAANPKYPPLHPARSLKLGGVVVRVMRTYYQ